MVRRRFYLTAAVVAATALGGCASGGSSGPDQVSMADAQAAPAEASSILVHNHNWSDVNVFLIRNGVKTRLGSVTTNGNASFTVPGNLLAGATNLRLLVDPIGSAQTFLTQPLLISPGQRLDLTVENQLGLSSYSIY